MLDHDPEFVEILTDLSQILHVVGLVFGGIKLTSRDMLGDLKSLHGIMSECNASYSHALRKAKTIHPC